MLRYIYIVACSGVLAYAFTWGLDTESIGRMISAIRGNSSPPISSGQSSPSQIALDYQRQEQARKEEESWCRRSWWKAKIYSEPDYSHGRVRYHVQDDSVWKLNSDGGAWCSAELEGHINKELRHPGGNNIFLFENGNLVEYIKFPDLSISKKYYYYRDTESD